MALDPRTRDKIYKSLRSELTNRISKLTNFARNSFNYIWTQSFADQLHQQEVAATAVQLSGWVDYSGKELTQEELDALGITSVDPEEINQFMDDSHLDELAKEMGVERDDGDRATGYVKVTTTSDTVTVPKGTEFGTQPDSFGEFLSFYTTEEASPGSGKSTVTIPVEAEEVGAEYNVGSGTITYIPSPPTGVEDVTNPDATSGGKDRESNDELRKSIKNAIFEQSGGGTLKGVKGYIESNVEGVKSVSLEEFTSSSPVYVDVIVEGGTDSEVKTAIEESRPVGVNHNLVRPTKYRLNVNATVSGGSIDTSGAENVLTTYISNLPLGGDVIRDKLIQKIMNADDDIDLIDNLSLEVDQETHVYEDADGDGTVDSVYQLDKGVDMAEDGIVEVTGVLNGSSHTFVEGTDYEEIDNDGDTSHDAIDWSIGGDSPDTGTEFYVTYEIANDLTIEPREKTETAIIDVTG